MSAYSNPLAGNLSNVGDLIIAVRTLGPDPPIGVLSAPALGTVAAATLAGGALPNGTWFVQVTQLNPWGESSPTTEQQVVTAGGQNGITLQVTPDFGAVAVRVYIGSVSGGENRCQVFAGTTITPGSQTTLNFTYVGMLQTVPPLNASAYLPDTDGGFVSAGTMYRWLNTALQTASRVCGGVQDAVGIASTSGQRRYITQLIGQWLRFDQCFYDGWELDLGNKGETFRNRNLTANIAISLMVDAQSNSTRMELYWTPSRTSGSTTTSGPVTASAITIPINAPTGWLLADGYVLLTDGTNTEVISYSAQTPTQLTGCIRGWAGTQPFAFASGATVRELNLELNGYRMPYTYTLGQSALGLDAPPGWHPFLIDHMLGSFRMAEQETDEGKKLQDGANKSLMEWVKSNKPVAGPRQCRLYGDYGLRGTVPGGITGPIIIP